ncbi:universal stress protein [Leifsonia sp. Root112D2]|uniref:universal stress protein n=1 Tax=Leifsonia sp. Root112D2 TaxID=1736426 RepID=UPI000ABC2D78|nr:universal stress protein [Leifsonia sp. Root112D2]
MKKNIQVGIDGSDASRAAVRWAVKRTVATGTASGGSLTLVHVVDDDWGMMGTRIMDALREDGKALVKREAEYARALAPEVAVETEILAGNPMWRLIDASGDAMMTVVGTHKTGFIQGRIFGSRSLQLAAAARSHVAIIPQASSREGRGIVVGVDSSVAGRAALLFAAGESRETRQPLVLVRARRPMKHSIDIEDSEANGGELDTQTALAELSNAEEIARSVFPDIDVRLRNVQRAPAEALLDASSQASALIIGSSRRTGPESMVLGSVSHDVLLNLATPTIVVHGDETA